MVNNTLREETSRAGARQFLDAKKAGVRPQNSQNHPRIPLLTKIYERIVCKVIERPTIHDIKERAADGNSMRKMARDLHLHRHTVKKYIGKEGFSPKQPLVHRRKSKLDPFKPLIDKWIEEDLKRRRNDRQAAKPVRRCPRVGRSPRTRKSSRLSAQKLNMLSTW